MTGDQSLADAIEGDEAYRAHLAAGTRPSVASWAVWKGLETLRQRHESGDAWALWSALDGCLQASMMPPEWVREALHEGLERARMGEAKQLGDAFPPLTPKGAHATDARSRESEVQIAWLIAQREARRGGMEQNAVKDVQAEVAAYRGGRPPGESAARGLIHEGEKTFGPITWPHARNSRQEKDT